MNTVMEDLKQALCDTMTKTVVKEAVYNTSNMVYYDDFLGNGDHDKDGKPVVCNHHKFNLIYASFSACL